MDYTLQLTEMLDLARLLTNIGFVVLFVISMIVGVVLFNQAKGK